MDTTMHPFSDDPEDENSEVGYAVARKANPEPFGEGELVGYVVSAVMWRRSDALREQMRLGRSTHFVVTFHDVSWP